MNLEELLKDVEVEEIRGSLQTKVSGIAFNSKEVMPGSLFICIPGFKADGHNFAQEAVEAGAIAVVAERPLEHIAVTTIVVKNARLAMAKIAAVYYGYPFRRFRLIGVTGTNGKTTSTYLIKSILEHAGKTVGLIGTNQNIIDGEIVPSKHTTPDSLELMQLFGKMADSGVDYVVMEVSSHSLALDRVAACEFDIGAFTNITQDHLDFHKDMQDYLAAKAKLFSMCRIGVINKDDKVFDYLKEHSCCEVLSYGMSEECDLRADKTVLHEVGVNFTLSYQGETESGFLGIPGRFSVYNAMTAAGCCLAAGLDLSDVMEGLRGAHGVKGRIEVVPLNAPYTVIIDYAHTPDGLMNVLQALRDFAKGRIVTLFGCGGDRDRSKRPIMGKIAAELSDFCIVTSDNPRSEEPGAIIADILPGVKETNCEYTVIENRFDAIAYALDRAQKDDIILLAGKGHETYQVLKDRTIDFDEREIVMKLLGMTEVY